MKARLWKPSEAARQRLWVAVERVREALETPEDESGGGSGDEPG